MVCIGNICRSPMAEGIMRHLIQTQQLTNWTVASAAMISNHIGSAPHPSSQKVCREHGIDISGQRARLFKVSDIKHFDIIYAMADDVLEMIREQCGRKFDSQKVKLFLNELHPGKHESVPDPWYGTEEDYYPVFELIEKTCKRIVSNDTGSEI